MKKKKSVIYKKYGFWILSVFIFFHLFLLLKTRFTAWPEMMLWPYLILKGWLPYRDIAIAHNPLLVVDLTIFYKLFGVGALQLKIYTWLLILLTDLVLFGVVKRLWNTKTALLAIAFYIPLQVFYEGNGLWFDLALAPFALLIFYSLKTKQLVLVGVLWALAFLVKQTAFWFLIPIVIELYKIKNTKIKTAYQRFFVGVISTATLFVVLILLFGIFQDYWYWSVEFGIGILPRASGQIHFPTPLQLIKALLPYSIFIPILTTDYRKVSLLAVWAIAGLMGVYPRWELFHFQPSLPFLAVGFALLLNKLESLNSYFKIFTLTILIMSTVLMFRNIQRSWSSQTRFLEPQTLEIANAVKEKEHEGELMFVFDYWDNLYPLTDRMPAIRPWVPSLSWYLDQPSIEDKIFQQLEVNKPPIIVYSVAGEEVQNLSGEKIRRFIIENYTVSEYFGSVAIYELTK